MYEGYVRTFVVNDNGDSNAYAYDVFDCMFFECSTPTHSYPKTCCVYSFVMVSWHIASPLPVIVRPSSSVFLPLWAKSMT